jgi:hypothetical protein
MTILKDEVDGNSLKQDLVLYYKTADMDKPKLFLQESSEHPDEVACMMSFVPSFCN